MSKLRSLRRLISRLWYDSPPGMLLFCPTGRRGLSGVGAAGASGAALAAFHGVNLPKLRGYGLQLRGALLYQVREHDRPARRGAGGG